MIDIANWLSNNPSDTFDRSMIDIANWLSNNPSDTFDRTP
jgi:hypothetical protein